MKKHQILAALFVTGLLMTTGCGSQAQNNTSTDTPLASEKADLTEAPETETASKTEAAPKQTETAEVTETEATEGSEETEAAEPVQIPKQYLGILECYRNYYVQKAGVSDYLDQNLSIYAEMANSLPETTIGYQIVDLDEDGVEELLIGLMQKDAPMMILDLYSILREEAVRLAVSEERSVYYLGTEGIVYNEGSSSAKDTYYRISEICGDYLHETKVFAYDANISETAPWFEIDGENFEAIAESKFQQDLAEYETGRINLDLIPL